MFLVFFETPLFTRLLPDYLDDDGYRRLQKALLENPEKGDVMAGTGGFRKLRWQDPRRKGQAWRTAGHLLLSDGGPPNLVIHYLRQRRVSRP